MLHQTFIHIPGIGRHTELELWKGGIHNWDDADRFEKRFGLVGARIQKRLDEYIPASREAIRQRNAVFFERLSALGETWRVFPEFADQCVYLDIETTGLSTVFDRITVVGLYDGRKYKVFVDGENLDELPHNLKQHSVVVTFNGAIFDLRFLKLRFPDLVLPPIHIDLRWVARKLGFKGGLKSVEAEFGLTRAEGVKDISGYDATVLWAKHLRGEKGALEQLIQYNTEDVVHLKAIMEIAYDKLCEKSAAYLESDIAPMFTGVAAVPKAKRASLVRAIERETIVESRVSSLLQRCPGSSSSPRIVGIDLTGSERRATGWALMNGAVATTQALKSDDELLAATVEAKPDIVSIDSPLSLPQAYGKPGAPIYRKCELALKRMGISVFWCLLPTMEALTRRGMRLADELRKQGLKVIESYPGAAQDILGIPRKGASLQELKQGMARIGIAGEYLTTSVSHDEVDAITSALVGLFFLADDYIALGNAAEDYLVVPRSPNINYSKLSDIVRCTGLDEIPTLSMRNEIIPLPDSIVDATH